MESDEYRMWASSERSVEAECGFWRDEMEGTYHGW